MHLIDIAEPWTPAQATERIRSISRDVFCLSYTKHAKDQLLVRSLILGDVTLSFEEWLRLRSSGAGFAGGVLEVSDPMHHAELAKQGCPRRRHSGLDGKRDQGGHRDVGR